MKNRRHRPRFLKKLGVAHNVRRQQIKWVAIDSLTPSARNAHTHSKKQIRQIADSIERFGFINPIIVDDRNRIIAGVGRSEAAKLFGLSEVPVVQVSHLTEAEIRAYILADNKLAEKADWDDELLRIELSELEVLLPEVGLDLSITGFEPNEIDLILVDIDGGRPNPADDLPYLDSALPVARLGDLFVLGRHRLMAGDARERDSFKRLMLGEAARMAIRDVPYNQRIRDIGGRGRIKHREFLHGSGEFSKEEFVRFLKQSLSLCAEFSADGAIHYVFIDWRHMGELLAAGEAVYTELKNVCVWTKNIPGQGSFYRSQHELVFVFKHGTAPHLNTFELGQYGRTRSNVWPYAGVNSFRAGRLDELKMHPTVKPVALVADAMRDCSRRGDIVLDAFTGSGTTIIAAEQTGRRAFCMEIDPLYVDVCIRRWQEHTKRDAIVEATRQTFDELAASRSQIDKSPTTRATERTLRPPDNPQSALSPGNTASNRDEPSQSAKPPLSSKRTSSRAKERTSR